MILRNTFEKIKVNLIREKHPKLGVKYFFFKHSKFKHKNHKYKKIRLEKANSNFIVVRHFLAYIHYPQAPNRVRVPLYLKFQPNF